MIHYHGTPIGGSRQDVVRFLRGRHALVPFPRPEDVAAVADVCQSFVFDNGAFTIWKQGGELDYSGYVAWVREWCRHPGFDWLIPDAIDGTEEANDELLAQWPRDIPGVPVYHLHESTDRIDHLASVFPIVAIGSSGMWPTPGAEGWWHRMGEVMEAVCDEHGRPRCKLHGLRMLSTDVFERLPLASADSTNAAINSGSIKRFGMYCPPTSAQRAAVIAERIESHNSAAVWVRDKQMSLDELWEMSG